MIAMSALFSLESFGRSMKPFNIRASYLIRMGGMFACVLFAAWMASSVLLLSSLMSKPISYMGSV